MESTGQRLVSGGTPGIHVTETVAAGVGGRCKDGTQGRGVGARPIESWEAPHLSVSRSPKCAAPQTRTRSWSRGALSWIPWKNISRASISCITDGADRHVSKLPGGREGRQIFGGRLWTFAFRLALEGREGILTAIFLGTGRDYTNPMCIS